MLPFSYATRNLLRDPARFFQKSGGACLVVFLVFSAGSFNRGMDRILRSSGAPNNVILLGAGSEESVERSEVAVQAEELVVGGIPTIAKRDEIPAVSGEVHYMGIINTSTQREAQALLRGVTLRALEVHQEVRLIKGRFPQAGEVMLGKLTHRALKVEQSEVTVGKTIEFEDQTFVISGVFDAPGTVMESEIWMNRTDLMTLTQRDSLSCVVVRMESESGFNRADLFSKQRLDLELVAIRESDYYKQLSSFYAPIRWMTWLTTLMIATGAIFGGFNMLYAAFSSRIRELAALQTIGYSRKSLFISLMQESLLTTMTGTLLASILAVIFLEGTTLYFSIGAFVLSLDLPLILMALITGFALGTIGTIPPALRCLGTDLPKALRSS